MNSEIQVQQPWERQIKPLRTIEFSVGYMGLLRLPLRVRTDVSKYQEKLWRCIFNETEITVLLKGVSTRLSIWLT